MTDEPGKSKAELRADMAANEARAKALRPWYRKKRVIILGALVGLVVIAAVGSSSKDAADSTVAVAAATGDAEGFIGATDAPPADTEAAKETAAPETEPATTVVESTVATTEAPPTTKGRAKGQKRRDLEIESFLICRDFVKQRLRSPGSAKFRNPSERDGEVVWWSSDDLEWQVLSSVDAQNGFGALLRSQWDCTVRKIDKDRWKLVDLTIDDPE